VGFQHSPEFDGGVLEGGVTLGPLETQYQELFAEALEDGVITSEERTRLEQAADNLGLDRMRLARLEQAMVASYETNHRVKVVERWEEPAASLAPLRLDAEGDDARKALLKRIEQLEARVHELEDELREAQANINVEIDVSGLEGGGDSEDPHELRRQIRRDPTRVAPYRALYRHFDAEGDGDGKHLAAQALVALGAADETEKAFYDAHRQVTLITPKCAIPQSAWVDQLLDPEEDLLTGQIFGILAPAVLLGRVTGLRRAGQLQQPNAESRQDPAKATVTAVRALPWASALLGLPPPAIYLDKDKPHGYVLVPGVPPHTSVGRAVLCGVSPTAHAFLATRHLAFYRQERFIKQLYDSVQDLEDIFLAGLLIGKPSLPLAEDMRRRVGPLANAIEPLLEPVHIDGLRGCIGRFVEEGGRTNLQRWSAATERTANRAALLACGDLPTAVSCIADSGLGEGQWTDAQKELLGFAVSEPFSQLRRQVGVAL
jgi:hypothetical protein